MKRINVLIFLLYFATLLQAQITFINRYQSFPITKGDHELSVIGECNVGTTPAVWVAGRFFNNTNLQKGIIIEKLSRSTGAVLYQGIIENSSVDNYVYVPTDIIQLSGGIDGAIVTCLAYDNTGITLIGGLVARVSFNGSGTMSVDWKNRYVNPSGYQFRPYNIVAQNSTSTTNYWVAGEAFNPAGGGSQAMLMSLTAASGAAVTTKSYDGFNNTNPDGLRGLSITGNNLHFVGNMTQTFIGNIKSTMGHYDVITNSITGWKYYEQASSTNMYAEDILSTPTTTYVVGQGNSTGTGGNNQLFIYSLSNISGLPNWFKTYTINGVSPSYYQNVMVLKVVQVGNRLYILGRSNNNNNNDKCFMLITDLAGNVVSIKEYPIFVRPSADALWTDNNFIYFVGSVFSVTKKQYGVLVQTNLNGDVEGGFCITNISAIASNYTWANNNTFYTANNILPTTVYPNYLFTQHSMNFLVGCNSLTTDPPARLAQPQSPIHTNGFVVSPNPTTGRVILTIPNESAVSTTDIMLFDMQGKQILRETKLINEGNNELEYDLTHLPKGMYVFHIKIANEVSTQKLIVD